MLYLSTNSFHARAYMWFYKPSNDSLPTNLCPYFWKLLFMFIVIVPYTIFCLPSIIIFENDNEDTGERITTGERIFRSFIIYLFLVCIFSIGAAIGALWITYKEDSFFYHASILGIILIFIIVGTSAVQLFKYIEETVKEKRRNKKNNVYRREKTSNLVVEFAKAKYNKLCPRIDWK